MVKQKKIEVDRRALIARINRKLARAGKRLCVSRSSGEKQIGAYHIVKGGLILGRIADDERLKDFAREFGALADYETLAKVKK
jgi:hypothetical protein